MNLYNKRQRLPAAQCPGSLQLYTFHSSFFTFHFIFVIASSDHEYDHFFISLIITCMSAVEILPSEFRS